MIQSEIRCHAQDRCAQMMWNCAAMLTEQAYSNETDCIIMLMVNAA